MKNEFLVRSENTEYRIEKAGEAGKGRINGEEYAIDIIETATGYHAIRGLRSCNIDIISFDALTKQVELRINNRYYRYTVKDRYDEVLEAMGLDRKKGSRISEIKAPMPGLVLEVLVSSGDEVKADQPLLILEAMKMENVIKAPADCLVKKVEISKGDSVEKNQLLLALN